ncbi:MAG TPA: divergent PAP2 family protein [Anaerolineales bacterium]|nr:divergent PAP2 family protein [Anaerolineales bacterium]
MLDLLNNPILIAGLIGWAIAQVVKVPLESRKTHRWNWALLLAPGGMPSSHTALVVGITHATGLFLGYDSPLFAFGFAFCMVVIYDATGIRRQAGKHAEMINAMIEDLAAGHPLKEEQLREVLGHTPREVLGGLILGLTVAQIVYLLWK